MPATWSIQRSTITKRGLINLTSPAKTISRTMVRQMVANRRLGCREDGTQVQPYRAAQSLIVSREEEHQKKARPHWKAQIITRITA